MSAAVQKDKSPSRTLMLASICMLPFQPMLVTAIHAGLVEVQSVLLVLHDTQLLRSVALLWVLPTPNIFLAVEPRWLSFQVSELELRCKSYKRSEGRSSFPLSDETNPPKLRLIVERRNGVYYLSTLSNSIILTVFLVFVLNNKPWHIPLKYGCSIKKSDNMRAPFFLPIPYWSWSDFDLHARVWLLAKRVISEVYFWGVQRTSSEEKLR